MEVTFIILTLLLGITLILVEIFFIPGTTVVGVIGMLVVAGGVWGTYDHFGSTAGTYTMIGTSIFCLGAIIYSFRSGTWSFMAQKQVIDSKVNEHINLGLKLGDEGITVSSLRPMGTVSFNDEHVEVSTLGAFINAKEKVKIIEINSSGKEVKVEPVKS